MGRPKTGGWRSLWRAAGVRAAAAGAAALLACAAIGALEGLELRLYDAATSGGLPAPLSEIAVIGVDDASLAALPALRDTAGTRELYAALVDRLSRAGAKTIVLTAPLAEPQSDRGLAYVRKVRETIARAGDGSALAVELSRTTDEAEKALDADGRLAASLAQAGNVFLASRYTLAGGTATAMPDYAHRSVLSDPGAMAVPATSAHYPAAAIGSAAAGVGHLAAAPDDDGRVREVPLMLRHDGVGVPALALLAAAHSLHLGIQDLRVQDTRGVWLGGLQVPTDGTATLRPRFAAQTPEAHRPYAPLSLVQVIDGRVPPQTFQGKIVLVGEVSDALAAPWSLPGLRTAHPVEVLAETVGAIRQRLVVVRPAWAAVLSWGAVLAGLLLVALLLPRWPGSARWAAGAALVLLLVSVEWALLRYTGQWLPLLPGAVALLAGLSALAVLRAMAPPSPDSSLEAAETDRMMGLALQGQGQFDKALERLRRVPPSDALMDNLYHLAADFERMRNFAKAKSTYKLILQHDRNFKDAYARYKRVRGLLHKDNVPSSTPMVDPTGPHLPGDARAGLPTLGRYRIDKEIGKGAMGVVYLGKDPTIGRVVAIKTLALGTEFEGEALVDARARFFREAETAGRLQHPYIVAIFDAGEEHDLAYIAMEFLKGADLTEFCRAGHLLPAPVVVSIAARVAEALDYAHAHNVVHRDIKPANIMYDSATDAVKVTDFGIARITDSSKTRTGLVLGTPSFMSPEQLAGKKVDGRADLYALGVTLFQLLTGSLPLRGASMTELMHKIANVSAPDIRELRPDLSPALALVVARALQKRPEDRYQTGRQFAEELRQAGASAASTPSPAAETLVYDARRDATGHEMADHPKTVMATPGGRDASSSSPISGAR